MPTLRLFLALHHSGALRNFETLVHELSARGHAVHLALEQAPLKNEMLNDLLTAAIRLPRVTWASLPPPSRPYVAATGRAARCGRDLLRYLTPPYADARAPRARARQAAPPVVGQLFDFGVLRRPRARWSTDAALRRLDAAIPPDPALTSHLREHAPDLVLVSPLVEFGSPQADILRAALALGLPSGLLVHSWDNLTVKGLVPASVARSLALVAVWNAEQRDEAVRLHGVPADRIAITGANPYDVWFERTPSRDRHAFCSEVGLDPRRAFVLYVCSSPFIAPYEGARVRRWIGALRATCGAAAAAQILVRPHPQNREAWQGVHLNDLADVRVWPPEGADPVDEYSRSGYFDSIYHSAAVAGINTSALIESAIVGRPVHTLIDRESQGTQTGTLHFRALVRHNHGFLRIARSVEEQARQLATAITVPDGRRDEEFLRAFVRPFGLDEAATPRLADAIEAAARHRPVGGTPSTAVPLSSATCRRR